MSDTARLVVCSVCTDEVRVPAGREVADPYVCTVCIGRGLKRLERREAAEARRMNHGGRVRKKHVA